MARASMNSKALPIILSGRGDLRSEPFRERNPGAALPDLAGCVFHLELSSLSEEVAALG